MDRLLDLVPDHRDRALARGAQPEVPVVEQEVDAVLLRLDRVVAGARADHCEVRHTHLEPARSARFGTRFASDLDGGLGGQLGEPRPHLGGELALHEDRLTDARAIAQDGEGDLAGRAEMRDPRADDD